MVRIIYNNVELDIDPAQDLFWSIASTDLSNLSVREGGYNNTWQLPNTQRNREAFGMITEVDGNLDAAFVFRDVRVYDGNTLVLVGIGRVVDIRLDAIGLLVVSSVGGLGERLDALRAEEVVLGFNEAGSITSTLGDLLLFPLLDGGYTQAFNNDNSRFCSSIATPWVNLRKAAELIITQCGYTVDNEQADDLETSTYVGGLFRFDNGSILEDSSRTYDLLQVTFRQSTGGLQPPNERWWPASPPYQLDNIFSNAVGGNAWVNNLLQFEPPFNDRRVIIRCKYNISWTNAVFGSGVLPSYSNSIYLELYSQLRIVNRLVFFGAASGTLQGEFDFEWLGPEGQLAWRLVTQNDNYRIQITNGTVSLEPADIMASRVTLRGVCDLSPRDVLSEYFNRFGVIATVDETRKKVTMRKLANLGNKANALDWSGKVRVPEEAAFVGPYESSFVYGELAIRNLYTHESGIGTGIITTQVTTGEAEREALASPLSVYADEYRNVYSYFFAQSNASTWEAKPVTYRLWDIGETYSGADIVRDTLPDFYTVRPPFTVSSPPDGTTIGWVRAGYNTVFANYNAVSQIAQFTRTPIGPDSPWSGTIIFEFRDAGTITAFITPAFAPQYWQPLLNNYYQPITSALTRPRVDKYYIALNEADIANLDFSRPIYLNGSYYYIVLIDQYDVINKTPTPVVLLRLI